MSGGFKPSTEELQSWMEAALAEAELAEMAGEVPIGSVIVRRGTIIASGHNEVEGTPSAVRHAELLALERASRTLGSWRLSEAVLVATLEPCAMCVGAALLARIPLIVFGARDPRFGSLGSLYDLSLQNPFGQPPRVIGGIREKQCGALLSEFFKGRRKEALS